MIELDPSLLNRNQKAALVVIFVKWAKLAKESGDYLRSRGKDGQALKQEEKFRTFSQYAAWLKK